MHLKLMREWVAKSSRVAESGIVAVVARRRAARRLA
jgi:hypothetical protein